MNEDGPAPPLGEGKQDDPRDDTPPPSHFGGKSRRLFFISALSTLALAVAVATGGAYWYIERDFDLPAAPPGKKNIIFRAKSGMGLGEISRALREAKLIRDPNLFRLQARLRGGADRIHVGAYSLSPSMTPRHIYQDITEGRVAQFTLTIPEGYNLQEIASAIEKAGFGSRRKVLALAADSAFLASLKIQAASLEGYLFPDTYRFPLETPPRKILVRMVDTLRRKFGPELRRRAAERNLTIHQTLTLASIIEKETSVESERPIVAAVFVNRLRRKMRLQSDPTVIYALPNFDGNIRRRDLAYDSPYNTYRYKGLPPGPITSPGFASIRAALHPAPVDYLYFVATRRGGHKFSRSYKEHRSAVRRYQLRKGKVDR